MQWNYIQKEFQYFQFTVAIQNAFGAFGLTSA